MDNYDRYCPCYRPCCPFEDNALFSKETKQATSIVLIVLQILGLSLVAVWWLSTNSLLGIEATTAYRIGVGGAAIFLTGAVLWCYLGYYKKESSKMAVHIITVIALLTLIASFVISRGWIPGVEMGIGQYLIPPGVLLLCGAALPYGNLLVEWAGKTPKKC